MSTKLPMELQFKPLGDKARSLEDWLTTFHLASVVIDPYTNESSWVLKTAERILDELRGSHARVNFIVAANEADSKRFLGPLTTRFLVFSDPEREIIKALELQSLPAFTFIRVDGVAVATAQGWDPDEWRAVADAVTATTKWRTPDIPEPQDPGAFAGTPATG